MPRLLAASVALSSSIAAAQNIPAPAEASVAVSYRDGQPLAVEVVIRAIVDEAGRVTEAALVEQGPGDAPAVFAESALAAVKEQSFVPPVENGRPVSSERRLTLRFVPPAPAPSTPEAPSTMIRVRGRRVETGTGEVHFRGALVNALPGRTSEELLQSAPGMLLTNHGGTGHASEMTLRGFVAGEGEALEFRVEGVPLNEVSNAHTHGYADTNHVIPEIVDELHVVEGPSDARQGDFAVAGTVDYHLCLHDRGWHLFGGTGS